MTTPLNGRPIDRIDQSGPGDGGRKKPKSDAATGASAAGIRAVSARIAAFYFRAPIKAFFRTRVDYMAYARAINPRVQANLGWSWHVTTPALLAHAVREYGWKFIPNQVLPPLLANITIGAVLYTSYLQALGSFHRPSSRSSKRVYPPALPHHVFGAGFIAGTVHSVFAAPFDALQVRFRTNEMLDGRYTNMWQYSRNKLQEIGYRGVFAGWSLSLLKDSFGCGIFFATFELLKSQAYYSFLRHYYGRYDQSSPLHSFRNTVLIEDGRPLIKPHYLLEPSFILLAGISASLAQQVVQHPLTEIQNVHYGRLESLDYSVRTRPKQPGRMMRLYYHAYEKTLEQCKMQAKRVGGWRKWLYRDFWMNTLRQVPSTSAGLIAFEVVRRKYALDADVVRIEMDGVDVVLT